jgi:thiol-disulfide isomerase/thioredoxin
MIAVVKRDCPTCVLVAPVLEQLATDTSVHLILYSQDDPSFPEGVPDVVDDTDLDVSWTLGIETVPTLVRRVDGEESARLEGWSRTEWEAFTGVDGLGPDLPDWRPGCGSLSVDPARADELAVRHQGGSLRSRRVDLAVLEDDHEAMFERGWTDGLPVVPPTPARVLRMLGGTTRDPQEVVAVVPPDLVECTVEKVAVNAVMAGCRPEYLPIVLAAVEAACTDEFNMHGLLCTTWFSGPAVIVNGPAAARVGMNSGLNALGQGNRANATIGRALQLVVRNVGGGRPGEIDRATLGNPGKYTFCFAEDETGSPWESLAVERGFAPDQSTVTLFAAEGVRGVVDQASREPESLARSFAACLRTVAHPKLAIAFDAMLVVSPEHARVFRDAGWSKARLREELDALLLLDGDEIVQGTGGIAEGMPAGFAGIPLPKFRPGGLLITHAGGTAGLFSAIVGGWASGAMGSEIVTHPIGI